MQKNLVNDYLEQMKSAAEQGNFEYEANVSKIAYKNLLRKLRSMGFAAVYFVARDKSILVRCYWGPAKNKNLSINKTKQEWLKDREINGYKR